MAYPPLLHGIYQSPRARRKPFVVLQRQLKQTQAGDSSGRAFVKPALARHRPDPSGNVGGIRRRSDPFERGRRN